MKVVIQCAGTKKPNGFFRTADGLPVKFVANPGLASTAERQAHLLVRPDEIARDSGRTWRQLVLDYDATAKTTGDPSKLWPAYQLYGNAAYVRLVEKFGIDKVFILSAGWGLIRADFLTPNYDITFSGSAEAFQRRRRTDRYDDFNQLTDETSGPVVFLGGKDYQSLFVRLTNGLRAERVIFYNSATVPTAPGCRVKRFETDMRTNWHYHCAAELAEGKLGLEI